MGPSAVVMGVKQASETGSPQGQALTPLITADTAGVAGLSGGMVRMPPCGVSRAHLHDHTEIIVAVLSGAAATVVWKDGEPQPLFHASDELCYVPAGVPHGAVNLSSELPVSALEFRTDPAFNDDVVLLPELEEEFATLAKKLQAEHQGQ